MLGVLPLDSLEQFDHLQVILTDQHVQDLEVLTLDLSVYIYMKIY